MFIRVTAFVIGLLTLAMAIGILTTAPFSETANEATYPVASLLCLTSIGFLLSVREGEKNDELEHDLRWSRRNEMSNEARSDNYRHIVMKQADRIDELGQEVIFLREKYHKDIEGAKYETV